MLPLALVGIALEIAKIAAPKLVRALTDSDDAANIADRVIDVAQQVTGTGTPQEALVKLQADPALVIQSNVRMQEIEADLEKAYLADVADARKRDMALAAAGQRNKRADVMVACDVIGLIVCIAAIAYIQVNHEGEMAVVVTLLSTIAGYFGICLRDAHQFEFGSSRGSKEKDQILASMERH